MHTEHLRLKANILRGQGFTIDEIADKVNVPRGTVYGWVGHIPIPRTNKQQKALWRTNRNRSKKWAAKRQTAFDEAKIRASELLADRDVRDFVCVYLCEGYRRDRNRVEVTNSNPSIIAVAARVMKARSRRKVTCTVHCYDDHDAETVRKFWSTVCNLPLDLVTVRPKTGTGKLAGRDNASRHGVCHVLTSDTYFRSWLQALMDQLQDEWNTGGSEVVSRAVWDRQIAGSTPAHPT